MAYTCELREGVLRIVFSGCVNMDEVYRMLDEIEKVEANLDRSPDRIADLSLVDEMDLNFAGVERVAARRRLMQFKNPVRAAIVAPRPLQYGFARMYQTLSENKAVELQIFERLSEAEHWISTDSAQDPVI